MYATLILGDNAYGTTEIEGGGLTLIVKQLGSGGASDPLDQRASVARDVYATLILGDNAYGTTEIEGGGLTLIVKQLGSGGASDPLDQRASVAWKATKAAVRLQEAYMVRIETTSTFTGE